jgi:predicted nuclease of restriction endonuclease-like (RecB) superfamily
MSILSGYENLLGDIASLLESARRSAARSINALMTATYWLIGRRIVEFEQAGAARAEYGAELLKRLSGDLSTRFGRGFSERNLDQMRLFYLNWNISQTVSAESLPSQISQTLSSNSFVPGLPAKKSTPINVINFPNRFALPWSHYVRLLSVKNEQARRFYEAEALRCGWSVRQLQRQINYQFYERTALSRNKAAMLKKGEIPLAEDIVTPEEEIKDPYVLEFLNLKDEYSESDLEEALIRHLETFLLELGGDFCFIGRQKRLRIGNTWYRVDLIFFHRHLRCLVVIDLKMGEFTHADAGQMHLYLNYVRENWMNEGENPPVGLILCSEKDEAVVRYALEGMPNKILASQYKMTLPDEKILAAEIEKTRKRVVASGDIKTTPPHCKGTARVIPKKKDQEGKINGK